MGFCRALRSGVRRQEDSTCAVIQWVVTRENTIENLQYPNVSDSDIGSSGFETTFSVGGQGGMTPSQFPASLPR